MPIMSNCPCKRLVTLLLAVAASALLPPTAIAADNGFYLGLARTEPDAELSAVGEQYFDDGDRGFKVIAGLRPLDWLGIEASYVDFGDVDQARNVPDFSDFQFEQTGVDVAAVFVKDIALFDLFAKAGVVKWELEGSGSTFAGRTDASADGEDFTWGLGAQARFGSFALRLEYQRFDIDASDGPITRVETPELVSLGFVWTLL